MSDESLQAAMNFPLHREVLDEPRTVYSAPPKTGWPAPALAQDDSRPLFRWFASRPDARRRVREAVYSAPVPDCETTYGMFVSGWVYLAGAGCIAIGGGFFWLVYLWWRT